MLKKYIGNRQFYRIALTVALPMMIQNAITNFVSLLDNIMVGQVGTVQMTGVSIANQLLFIFNLCIFGAISGASIFGAQFYGKGDHEGVRYTFRFKLLLCGTLLTAAVAILLAFGAPLINLYLLGDSTVENAGESLTYGLSYLRIMLIGCVPYAVVQTYASTLRETGETLLPMKAGITAICVNLLFNYILIFGHFGCPAMGVAGAAIATVLSRFVEAAIVVTWTARHAEKNPFIVGAFRSLYIPKSLFRQILIKGIPLMINETLWATGIAMLNQCYSFRGYDVVAAQNIASTISNLFNVVYMSLGSAIGVIVGQSLGAGDTEEAIDRDRKLIAFSVSTCLIFGVVLFFVAPLFPQLYNTTDDIRALATSLIRITACCMPIAAFMHACYFTLRTGGRTLITFLFDSAYVCGVAVPVAFVLSHFTAMPLLGIYVTIQGMDLIKCVVGAILVKKQVWVNNLVAG